MFVIAGCLLVLAGKKREVVQKHDACKLDKDKKQTTPHTTLITHTEHHAPTQRPEQPTESRNREAMNLK